MKTVKLAGHTIKLYDSIDELPIINFQRYNKYLLIDSGVGSDIDDIVGHVAKMQNLISLKDLQKLSVELQNYQQNLLYIANNISPKYLAFSALIQSIDGKQVDDYSDENLRRILDMLKAEKHSLIVSIFEAIKKKIDSELSLYFPDMFRDRQSAKLNNLLKQSIQITYNSIITGIDRQAEIDAINLQIYGMYNPKTFVGEKSVEITVDKQFEICCAIIGQKTGLDAHNMTVLQYYTTIGHINDVAKQESKMLKSNNHGRR